LPKGAKMSEIVSSMTSYIKDDEIESSKEAVFKILEDEYWNKKYIDTDGREVTVTSHQKAEKFELPPCSGYNMIIKMCDRYEEKIVIKDKDGKDVNLIIPASVSANDKYTTTVGWVIAQGPECYRDKERFPSGARCRVGDFILFPRYAGGAVMNYLGINVKIIEDVHCMSPLKDPSYIIQ